MSICLSPRSRAMACYGCSALQLQQEAVAGLVGHGELRSRVAEPLNKIRLTDRQGKHFFEATPAMPKRLPLAQPWWGRGPSRAAFGYAGRRGPTQPRCGDAASLPCWPCWPCCCPELLSLSLQGTAGALLHRWVAASRKVSKGRQIVVVRYCCLSCFPISRTRETPSRTAACSACWSRRMTRAAQENRVGFLSHRTSPWKGLLCWLLLFLLPLPLLSVLIAIPRCHDVLH